MPVFENQGYPSDPEPIAAMQEPGPGAAVHGVDLLELEDRAEDPHGRA